MSSGGLNRKNSNEDFIDCYEKHRDSGYGFKGKIAKELGINPSSVTKRIEHMKRVGLIAMDSGHKVEAGMILRKAATYHPKNEETGQPAQWLSMDVPKENALRAFEEAIDSLAERIRPVEPLPAPTDTTNEYLVKYPFADGHIGLLTWNKEVGEDFDVAIATNVYIEAMRQIVSLMPSSDTCIFLDLGDTIHTDDQSNQTKGHKHQLDVDGRFDKLYDACIHILTSMIDIALQKHKKVIFRKTRGNHDPDMSIALGRHIKDYYRNEPRVVVEESPNIFYWYKFGRTLHFSTHGHNIKQKDLPEIIAHDCKAVWSDVDYVYADTGHIHHQEVIETRTAKLESHNSMAAGDSYNYGHGYRSMRLLKGIAYHKKFGEKIRQIITVKEVEEILKVK